MKNAILVFVLITVCIGLSAQTASIRTRARFNDENKYDDKQNNDRIDRTYMKNDSIHNDCVIAMVNGKMIMMKDGNTVMMNKEVVMKNGTIVMPDGTMRIKDGETIRIKEGDCIDSSGRIVLNGIPMRENQKNGIQQ